MKKVLLYSGGMDSWIISQLWKPDIKLYVDMHSHYSEQEKKFLPEDVLVYEFPLGQWERDDKIIPLRNLYLCMVACNITGDEDVEICLGATAGDRVLDKSPEFANKTTELLNFLYSEQWWIPTGKKVRINIDYKNYTKEQLLEMYKEQGGELEIAFKDSFSCYNPSDEGEECWMCKPCFRKFVAFNHAGYKFSPEILTKVIPYIQYEIAPLIDSGQYGRGEKEEQAIMGVLKQYEDYCN